MMPLLKILLWDRGWKYDNGLWWKGRGKKRTYEIPKEKILDINVDRNTPISKWNIKGPEGSQIGGFSSLHLS